MYAIPFSTFDLTIKLTRMIYRTSPDVSFFAQTRDSPRVTLASEADDVAECD